jgi:hypothetical protein
MKQADEIIDLLNEKLGHNALDWKGDHASIRFENGVVVDFLKLDAQTIELVSLIDQFRGQLNAKMYQTLLVSNYQGAMSEQFRIAVTPTDETIAICGRVDVTRHDETSFETLITEFVQIAAFWNSAEAMTYILSGPVDEQAFQPVEDQDLIVTRL